MPYSSVNSLFPFLQGKKTPMNYVTTFESVVTQQLSCSLTMAKSILIWMFIDITFLFFPALWFIHCFPLTCNLLVKSWLLVGTNLNSFKLLYRGNSQKPYFNYFLSLSYPLFKTSVYGMVLWNNIQFKLRTSLKPCAYWTTVETTSNPSVL